MMTERAQIVRPKDEFVEVSLNLMRVSTNESEEKQAGNDGEVDRYQRIPTYCSAVQV